MTGLQHHRLFVYQRTGLHRKQQQQQQRQCRRSSFFAPPSATMRNQAALVDHLKSQGVIKHNDGEADVTGQAQQIFLNGYGAEGGQQKHP